MASTEDLPTRRAPPPHHVRIPKLTYRNAVSTTGTSSPSTPTEPFPWPLSPTSSGIPTPERPSFDSRSIASSSVASSSSNVSTSRDSKMSKSKKSGGGMFGFLSLKEPSQLALEQFAEAQRKQAVEKGVKVPTIAVPAVSVQKLPSTVPKVNSKWDGVPDKLRAVEAEKKRMSTSTRSTSRMSTLSIFSIATTENQGPPPSLASAASSVSNVTVGSGGDRRDSGLTVSEQEMASLRSTPSTANLPEISYFFPDNPNLSQEIPSSTGPETPPAQQTTTATSTNITTSSTSSSSLSTSRTSTLSDASIMSSTNTSPSMMGNSNVTAKPQSRSEMIRQITLQGFLAGEAREVELSDSSEDEESDAEANHYAFLTHLQRTAADHSLLAPPTSIDTTPSKRPPVPPRNFSRPLARHSMPARPNHPIRISSMPRPGISSLPTLYEASICSAQQHNRSSDEISIITTDTFDLTPPTVPRRDPNHNYHQQHDDDDLSDTESVAASITPSEMSASWQQSPRERLGLGGRIRRSEAAPWDLDVGAVAGKRKKRPMTMSVFGRSVS